MPEEKKEDKPSILKRLFRGDTLDGSIEAARTKTLTEDVDIEAKRKKLLERVDKFLKEIKEERRLLREIK